MRVSRNFYAISNYSAPNIIYNYFEMHLKQLVKYLRYTTGISKMEQFSIRKHLKSKHVHVTNVYIREYAVNNIKTEFEKKTKYYIKENIYQKSISEII